jgi:hypothetical protein
MQNGFDIVVNVFESNIQTIAVNVLRDIVQYEIAVSIGTRYFQRAFVIARTAPTRKLFVVDHLMWIERRDIALLGGCGNVFHAPQRSTPIEVLQLITGSNAHRVRTLRCFQKPDLPGLIETDVLGCGRLEQGDREEGENSEPTHMDSIVRWAAVRPKKEKNLRARNGVFPTSVPR